MHRAGRASPPTLVTDDPIWDGIGTLAIGVLLAVIAIVLAIEMKSLLIGETADAKVRGRDPGRHRGRRRPSSASSTCAPSTSGPRSCSSAPR